MASADLLLVRRPSKAVKGLSIDFRRSWRTRIVADNS
jgi:hypothetical protein